MTSSRRPSTRLLAAVLVSGTAWGVSASADVGTDSVTWTENGAQKTRTGVLVEAAGWDKVVFSQGGRRTNVDGADVVEIRWGDAPREFDAASAALRSGDREAALAGFDATLKNRGTPRGWLVEHGSLGLGEAHLAFRRADQMSLDKAAHAFGTAREANPRSLVTDRILGGLADAELRRGRPDAALAAANDLENDARSARRPAWQAAALLLRVRALDAKRDPAGALRAADEVISFVDSRAGAVKDPELAERLRRTLVRAWLRKVWLLVAESEASKSPDAADRARRSADEASSRWPGDSEVEATASNVGGVLLLAAGDAKRALRKFQETEVLHFDVPDEAARALYQQSICHERLGDEPRRLSVLRQLVDTYPDSDWARLAR